MKNKVLSAFNKSASKLSKNGFVQAAVIVLILISCIISTAAFSTNCKEVRDNVLRLHILANSDSEEDQALKLKIRDKLLTEGADIFAGAEDADSAAEKIAAAAERLETLAEDTAREMGYNYDVKVELTEEYFDTRSYEDKTLPAGKYRAVKVIIGSGEGKNWWCVMFPPLCLPAAEEHDDKDVKIDAILTSGGARLIEKNPKFEVRFKIVEIYEKIKSYFND
ncbi:MAG: stage II sporulation protein R [Clostridiales bacterium]|nr:stage II sporulation protein R [Clostridiales bacterium]HOA33093.1 stage II sporulation protein R [Clostridiales bacterium]HOJ35417.1 stage II sporulation protein R [Clostridiales bacterium]HOL79303.1 stage II sporulation protein R [Clostridiales bacterium]HPP68134.1 stage II sporulation protein R [Clostridiales bacterium]